MKGAGREESEGHVRSTMEVQEQHISVYIQSINVVNSSSNTKSKMSKKKNSQKLPSIISHPRALLDTDQNRSEARRRATHGADPLIPVTNTQQTSLTAHYRELLSCWAAGSELFGRKTSLFHINSLLCMKWWNNLVPSETTGIIMYRVQHAEPPASGTCSSVFVPQLLLALSACVLIKHELRAP